MAIVRTCQLCENFDVHCKCCDCTVNKYFCDQCKIIHLRTDSVSHHRVEEVNYRLGQLYEQDFVTCELEVCIKCLPKFHHNHKVHDIANGFNEYIKEFKL